MADTYGFTYRRSARPRHFWLGDRWATPAERRSAARFVTRGFDAMEKAGAAGRDVAAIEVTDRTSRWTPLLDAWIAVFTSVDSAHASTLDHSNYRDTEENWPMRDGFGALVARYCADVPVALNTPVERIDWSGRRVAVDTPGGFIEARAVIVTVSTGVLAAGTIRFTPALPDGKRTAIEALPTGHANKIALQFDGDVFGDMPRHFRLLSQISGETILFQVRPFGWPMAIGFVGGRLSAGLEAAGEQVAIDLALGHLTEAFGSGIARHLRKAAFTGWTGDPWIRGAYSAARPGQAHRRADLAAAIDDRLFFAGEATSLDFFSTAHGAYLTGCAAARAAATAIGRISVS
jgi:monoamine oxidase